MYQVELSEAAVTDLDDFTPTEVDDILSFLLSLADHPQPAGIQLMSIPEAADGLAYLYETELYRLFYSIFEAARVVKVVGIFKKFSLS